MPHYISSGTMPHKRHTQYRKPDGQPYAEQLFSTEGFSTDYTVINKRIISGAISLLQQQISVPELSIDTHEYIMAPHKAHRIIEVDVYFGMPKGNAVCYVAEQP